MSTPDVRQALAELRELLTRCLPIIDSDASMMAAITRHAPLDHESQAKHDSTEYESEKLQREIRAALSEPPAHTDHPMRHWDRTCPACIAEPPKAGAAEGWQPIETAPMDGTALLVMRDIWPGTASGRAEECNGHNTYVAAWWANEGGSGRWVCYMDFIFDPTCPIVPTHWMPLPAAPKPEDTNGAA